MLSINYHPLILNNLSGPGLFHIGGAGASFNIRRKGFALFENLIPKPCSTVALFEKESRPGRARFGLPCCQEYLQSQAPQVRLLKPKMCSPKL